MNMKMFNSYSSGFLLAGILCRHMIQLLWFNYYIPTAEMLRLQKVPSQCGHTTQNTKLGEDKF